MGTKFANLKKISFISKNLNKNSLNLLIDASLTYGFSTTVYWCMPLCTANTDTASRHYAAINVDSDATFGENFYRKNRIYNFLYANEYWRCAFSNDPW